MRENSAMEAVRSELPYYPGVQMDAKDRGGTHRKLLFTRNGQSRFLVVARTPSDWRTPKNTLRDFRLTMKELGAERVDQPVALAPKKRRTRGRAATISLRDKLFVVHIAADAKLIGRFRTPDNKAAAHWSLQLSPSPDLTAPPLIVLKKVEVEDGKKHHGAVAGFAVKGGAWRLAFTRSSTKALARIPNFRGSAAKLYEDKGEELVFQLPAGTIPTGFRKPDAAPAPVEARQSEDKGPLPSVAFVPHPVEAKPALPEAPALVDIGDRPLVLQMPKQTVSIEMAIAVLNKAKRRLGPSLRFTVVEDGFLTAVHRIGQ